MKIQDEIRGNAGKGKGDFLRRPFSRHETPPIPSRRAREYSVPKAACLAPCREFVIPRIRSRATSMRQAHAERTTWRLRNPQLTDLTNEATEGRGDEGVRPHTTAAACEQ